MSCRENKKLVEKINIGCAKFSCLQTLIKVNPMDLLTTFEGFERRYFAMKEELEQCKAENLQVSRLEHEIKQLKEDNIKLNHIITIQQENISRTTLFQVSPSNLFFLVESSLRKQPILLLNRTSRKTKKYKKY